MVAKEFDVIAAGHLCVDITPSFREGERRGLSDILCPGKLVDVDSAAVSLGGAVANTGLALARFGLKLQAIAGVGDDDLGNVAMRLLERHGAAGAIRPRAGASTSYTVVLALPGTDRIFLHCPGMNDTFGLSDIDFNAVAGGRLFHFGYPPLMRAMYADDGVQLAEIFSRVKALGVATSLDVALPDPGSPAGKAPWARILERALPNVDVFLPSIEELYYMLEPDRCLDLKARHPGEDIVEKIPFADFQRLAGKVLAMGCGVCVIKGGRRGSYIRAAEAGRLAGLAQAGGIDARQWGGRELWAPAFKVSKIASATGSGDCSIAGFLAGMLRGEPLERCARLGAAAGFFNLRALDSLSGLPPWEELQAFIDGNPPTEDPDLPADLFTRDPATGLLNPARSA